jgi:hypothetical protein
MPLDPASILELCCPPFTFIVYWVLRCTTCVEDYRKLVCTVRQSAYGDTENTAHWQRGSVPPKRHPEQIVHSPFQIWEAPPFPVVPLGFRHRPGKQCLFGLVIRLEEFVFGQWRKNSMPMRICQLELGFRLISAFCTLIEIGP